MAAGLLAAIAALAAPMAMRVLLALGISVLTIGGAAVAVSSLKDAVLGAFAGAPLVVLQLIGLGGGWVALGALLGSVSFSLALWSLTKVTRLAFVS